MADINTQKFTNIVGDNLIVIPDTTGASNGYVLTYNSTSGIAWKAPQGGGSGGGVSPIVTSEIIPVLENTKYIITIPSNNAYYIVNDLQGDAEIHLPIIAENENYNITLFIKSTLEYDKEIKVYGEIETGDIYGVVPMDSKTKYGGMYGMGLIQFVFLGRGYTMTGLPTEYS